MTEQPIALPGVVVEPGWLEGLLGRPSLRLLDMREADAYASGHLPGALHLDLAHLGTADRGLENVLLAPPEFAALMGGLGVSGDSTVVAYDDQWGLAAARLLWALHYYGHDAVAVLNGGWDRWREEGRPVTDDTVAPTTGRFEPAPRPELAATREWLTRPETRTDVVLLDTRTAGEFERGHLPNAKSWDWFNAVPPGSWEVAGDLAALRSEWADLGVKPTDEVVVYCRSGMRAAHTYMALRLADYDRVRLYDGSWQEWSMAEGDGDDS